MLHNILVQLVLMKFKSVEHKHHSSIGMLD